MTLRKIALGLLVGTVLAALPALAAEPASRDDAQALTVCADPGNLPYSNDKQEGFENKIAKLVADDLHLELRYAWFPQHRTFLRRTLLSELCDVVISVPNGLNLIAETKPYFASTYVAVTRAQDDRKFTSFDDPWLRDARIGLQLVGKEGVTTPVAMALARRGINDHIAAFAVWGAPGDSAPQGKIIDAVADGSIDVALVWGPFAGYFAKAHGGALRLQPISADSQGPDLTFGYAMAMGVRKTDTALRDRLQGALDLHADEIAAILKDYGIPTIALPMPGTTVAGEPSAATQQTH